MEIHEPAVLEIVQGKKVTVLRWETREEGRDLIAAIMRRTGQLPDDGVAWHIGSGYFCAGDGDEVDAEIDDDETQPQGEQPYPDAAAPDTPEELAAQAELPWTSVHPFSASAAVVGKCAACGRERGDAVHEQPGETPDDGPEPYPAEDGLRCGAEDGTWACGAQRGHGGPDHLAYAAGEIRHRWPVTATVRAGSIGPFPILAAPPSLCHYCDVEPATAGDYCEACAPAVQLATGDGTRVVPEASRT